MRQSPGAARYHIPGYPVTPLVFLSLTAVILTLMMASRPKEALVGVLVVAVGAAVYPLVRTSGRPGVVEEGGRR